MKTSDYPDEVLQRIAGAVNRRFNNQHSEPLDGALFYNSALKPANNDGFEYIIGACQYPAGLFDSQPAHDAYHRLAEMLTLRKLAPRALILTGDQIYADATAGLFDPVQLDDNYRRSYERLLHSLPVREVMRHVPVVAMLDDHEIYNNYEPIDAAHQPDQMRRNTEQLQTAIGHYLQYFRNQRPSIAGSGLATDLWFTPENAGLPIFVADTRTERELRKAQSFFQSGIMSEGQFDALKSWLQNPAHGDRPKLIVSASLLLPRHSKLLAGPYNDARPTTNSLLTDSWDGYPASLYTLLGFITDNHISNVVFISGDEHLGCACRARISRESTNGQNHEEVVIHSIHTSALFAPYPFANAQPSDLIANERFAFQPPEASVGNPPGKYSCQLESSFYPGFGFTLMKLYKENDHWQLSCEFERANAADSDIYKSTLV